MELIYRNDVEIQTKQILVVDEHVNRILSVVGNEMETDTFGSVNFVKESQFNIIVLCDDDWGNVGYLLEHEGHLIIAVHFDDGTYFFSSTLLPGNYPSSILEHVNVEHDIDCNTIRVSRLGHYGVVQSFNTN